MFNPEKLNKVKKGDLLYADQWNSIIERLERLEKLDVSTPLILDNGIINPVISLSKFSITNRFQLTQDLNRGQQAEANIIKSDADGNFEIDTGTTIIVYDPFEELTGQETDRGYGILLPDSGELYEIIRLQHIATWIYFRTRETFSMMDSSFPVDVIEYWDGYSPETSAQSSNSSGSGDGLVYVHNMQHRPGSSGIYEFHGSDNLVGYATWDNYLRRYRLIQLQCG